MKKINYKNILILLLLMFYSCNNDSNTVIAGNNDFDIIDQIKIDLTNVVDFTADESNFFFLTDKEIIKTDLKGKILEKENHEKIRGLLINGDGSITKISYEGKILSDKKDTMNIKIHLSDDEKEEYETWFLASDGRNYYTCLFFFPINDRTTLSYSSQTIWFDESLEPQRFKFFVGIPNGLFYKDGKLFYISGGDPWTPCRSKDKLRLMVYDTSNNKELIKTLDIPIECPAGIYLDENGYYFTYSKYTKEVIKMKEK
jgi:hypothetical protein